MKREILIVLGLIVFTIFISSCIKQSTKSIREVNVCGDGVCGVTEDCEVCPEDCGCNPGEYCDEIGVCRKDVCGDEICSPIENRTQSCCEDCGCPSDKICNKVTQTCQERPSISDEDVKIIVETYLRTNNINGRIVNIVDTYYKNETVKQVNIDCKTQELPYPCLITLFISNEGKILEELRIV